MTAPIERLGPGTARDGERGSAMMAMVFMSKFLP